MGLMSDNDMMSMVQGMVDYTKQPQFNNQNVNNNGGFPFTNSQLPKQLANPQGLINQNNGLASSGNGNLNNQQSGGALNHGRSNNNAQIPQRGSDILSQPIFPSENNRLTTPSQIQGTSGNGVPSVGKIGSFNQNGNFNSNSGGTGTGGVTTTNNENNFQQPTVFVSSLGEISTDQNLRLNPFTTDIVSTRTFDTLSSNVDPISTSADQVQKFALHGQFNQLNDNALQKVQSNDGNGFNAGQLQPNNRVTLQQEINHLSESNEPNFSQQSGAQGSNGSSKFGATNGQNSGSNDQNDQTGQTLTAVYTGSGDLLSHTINQYGKVDSVQTSGQGIRDPNLSTLVNSLGETILTPIFTGEGNLLSQTISQIGSSKNQNDAKPKPKPDTVTTAAKQGNFLEIHSMKINRLTKHYVNCLGIAVSTPQPILQTPFFSEQSKVTAAPFASGTNNQGNVPQVNVVYSGEGNLLSQTIGQNKHAGQSQHSANGQTNKSTNNGALTSNESSSSSQRNQQKSSQTTHSQQTTSFVANRLSVAQQSVTNQRTPIGSSSSVTQTTQSIPSTQSFGQRVTEQQSKQQSSTTTNVRSNAVNQFSSAGQTTYNNRVSFGQKSATSTTTIPYSPSVPPFRSTITTTFTPSATSYSQQTQTYNGQQRHESRSFTQHDTFANNQFQVPTKEYLPSADNTRTARTNELSFGNHGSSTTRLSSSQTFARNQQDGRQQFTYPVDQVILTVFICVDQGLT